MEAGWDLVTLQCFGCHNLRSRSLANRIHIQLLCRRRHSRHHLQSCTYHRSLEAATVMVVAAMAVAAMAVMVVAAMAVMVVAVVVAGIA